MHRFAIVVFLMVLFCAVASSFSATIHVPSQQPTIQAGINAAVNGDTVLVAPGVYAESGITYFGKILTIASHFVLDSNWSTIENTIVDASGGGSAFIFSGGHVGQEVVGFTIRGGTGTVIESPPVPYGGAILISGSSPVIRNNIFHSNIVNGFGGALYLASGRAHIIQNEFRSNHALKGGALYLVGGDTAVVRDNLFFDNSADSGGAIFCWMNTLARVQKCDFDSNFSLRAGGGICRGLGGRLLLDSCVFTHNRSTTGGAISLHGETILGSLVVTASDFTGNTATGVGGGISAIQASGDHSARNCRFVGNTAGTDGGGIALNDSRLTTDSCIFDGNHSTNGGGGAIHFYNVGASAIRNCTVVKNSAPTLGGSGLYFELSSGVSVENTIVAFNELASAVRTNCPSAPTFSACDFYSNSGGDFSGSCTPQIGIGGNFAKNPLFCDTSGSSYTIRNISPCHPDSTPYGLVGAKGIGCFTDMVAFVGVTGEQGLSNIVNHVPQFIWTYSRADGFEQVEYRLEIGSNNDWAEAELWATGAIQVPDTVVIYAGGALLNGVTYYGRLLLSDSSGDGIWHEFSFRMNSVPTSPILRAPTNLAIVGSTPVLWVTNGTDAESDPLTYEFAGFHDTDCVAGPAIDLIGVASGVDSTGGQIVDPLAENCRYWWRARAYDGFEYSAWTDLAQFLVNGSPEAPTAPMLDYPPLPDNKPIFTLLPTLTWQASYDPDPGDTVRYKLELSDRANFSFALVRDSLLSTDLPLIDSLVFGTHYYWRVTAKDKSGLSAMSGVKEFWTWKLGDMNHSHTVDLSDLSLLIAYLTQTPRPDISPKMVADLTGNCKIDLSDLSVMVAFMTTSGVILQVGCE